MNRLAAHVITALGAVWLAGPAFALDPPKPAPTPKTTKIQPGPFSSSKSVITPLDIELFRGSSPAPGGDACPGMFGTLGSFWFWRVKNTGIASSKPTELVITCAMAGGNTSGWAPEAIQTWDRFHCACQRRTFQIPALPAGSHKGHLTWEGRTDHVPCNDPKSPHAYITAKIPGRTEHFHLCPGGWTSGTL